MHGEVTYSADELRRVLDDARLARGDRSGDSRNIPAWGQLLLAVLAVVISVVLAWANLDKRMSLIEQKMDYVVRQVGPSGSR